MKRIDMKELERIAGISYGVWQRSYGIGPIHEWASAPHSDRVSELRCTKAVLEEVGCIVEYEGDS